MVEILTDTRLGTAQRISRQAPGERDILAILERERSEMIEVRSHHHKKWPDYNRLSRGNHWRQPPIGGDSQITFNVGAKIERVVDAVTNEGRVRAEALALDPSAEMDARSIDARLQDVQDKNRVGQIQSKAMFDCLGLGLGWIYTWWDPERRRGKGDIRIGWLDAYNAFVDAQARTPEDIQLFAIRKFYSLAHAKATWPEFANDFQPEKGTRTRDNTSGLYRPIEDVPDVRRGSGYSTYLTGSGSEGGSFIVERGESDGRNQAEDGGEVHVWEWYVRSMWADAVIEPKVLAAQGRDAATVARGEHRDLLRGNPLDPDGQDDDATHLKVHGDFADANRERMTPDQQLMFTAHMELHQNRIKSPEARALRRSLHPGGWRLIQTCGKLLLFDGPTPTGSEYLPVGCLRNYEDNSSFYPLSSWAGNEGMAHGVNLIWSQIIDLIRVAAHRPIFADAASGIKKTDLVSMVGGILMCNFDDGKPPVKFGEVMQLDPSWMNAAMTLKANFEEQEGFSPATEGQTPFAGASGDAIGLLQQASQIRIQKRSTGLMSCMADVGRALVAQIVKFDIEPMMLKTQADPGRLPLGASPAGDGSFFVPVNQEGGGRLAGVNPDTIGITVNASSTLARGKTARRNELVGLGREGLIHPSIVRQGLMTLGVLSPRDIEMQNQLEQQAMMAQQAPAAGPATPPGASGGGAPPVEETFGDFDRQRNSESQQRG